MKTPLVDGKKINMCAECPHAMWLQIASPSFQCMKCGGYIWDETTIPDWCPLRNVKEKMNKPNLNRDIFPKSNVFMDWSTPDLCYFNTNEPKFPIYTVSKEELGEFIKHINEIVRERKNESER